MSTKPMLALPVEENVLSIARTRVADYLELAKVRLTTMVLVTTLAGFYMAAARPLDLALMLHTLLGTALVAVSAAVLNQVLERDTDARMVRTRNRPLAAGRIQPKEALILGMGCAALGLYYLAFWVNGLTSYLALLTLTTYLFLYTPLKRVSSLCTVVGAVPGALPIAMGWAAARGELGMGALGLFAILFVWQLPHFLAIAWMYREDYARGGFPMLPVIDRDGKTTSRHVMLNSVALVVASLLPALLGLTEPLYLLGSTLLAIGALVFAWRFASDRCLVRAKQLFVYSVTYLPLLVLWMAINKVP